MCPKDLGVLVALSSRPLSHTCHIVVFFISKISPLKLVDVLQTKPMPSFNVKFITLHCTSKCSKFTSSQVHNSQRAATGRTGNILSSVSPVFQMSPPGWTNPTGNWASVLSSLIKSSLSHANESLRTLSWYWPQFTFGQLTYGQFLGPTAW